MSDKSENYQSLRRRTIIVIVAILIVALPLLLFRSITDRIVDKIARNISLQYSQELNAQMTAHVSSTVDYYYHELNTCYNALNQIEDLSEENLRDFIFNTKLSNEISYLAFADSDGYMYESDGSYLGTMRVPLLGNLLSGTRRILNDNVTVGDEDLIMLGVSFDEPIRMGDKSIYIGLLGMDNDDLAEHIVLKSDYSGGFSSIIHIDGSYVIKNQAETKGGLNIFSILEKNYTISDDEVSSLKEAVNKGETYFLNAKVDGSENSEYMYFVQISGTDWYMVNVLPSSFIKSSVVDLRNTTENMYIAFVAFFFIVAAVIIIQQTTSSRRLSASRENLRQALALAEEASEAKTKFLFSMSHDIRTPMNAILGYTDIGLKHISDKELTLESFQKIKRAGDHLLNLINDILEMSRIESSKMSLNEKPVDIRDAIADVTTMCQSLAIAKSIDYETVTGEIQNPYIYADELHINEVIINIVSNAVKYTPLGGKVRYRIDQIDDAKDGKAVFRFEISDNGIGMSEEFQEHLFETFSREENSTISKTEGTGLGLSIVKRIVDMAGGDIKVQSARNQGSTFTVEIPFRVLDAEAIEKFESEKKAAGAISTAVDFSGKRVLLAEDNELNREIACYILEEAGMEVETAEDGSFAVNAVIDRGVDYYDFILMDIQMPVMNGYEATTNIRKLAGGESIPIIALSANAFEEDKKKSIDAGMNGHVAKPIDIKVLLETMQLLSKKE